MPKPWHTDTRSSGLTVSRALAVIAVLWENVSVLQTIHADLTSTKPKNIALQNVLLTPKTVMLRLKKKVA